MLEGWGTFVAMEAVQYYVNKGSAVNMVLLDASKAFDKVHYVKLFRLLMSRGLCPFIVRFLVNMYTKQTIRVSWANCVSSEACVSNGVKQDGVLSPVLFTVYIDELLSRLKHSGYGCRIGHVYVGALGYADDVSLLSPTKHGTNQLLKTCSEFALEYHMSFNPKKSKHIVFGSQQDIDIFFSGAKIDNVHNELHLGNPIGRDNLENAITKGVNDLYRQTNLLMTLFGKASPVVRYKLFNSFAMCLYGSQLWDLSNKKMDIFYAHNVPTIQNTLQTVELYL